MASFDFDVDDFDFGNMDLSYLDNMSVGNEGLPFSTSEQTNSIMAEANTNDNQIALPQPQNAATYPTTPDFWTTRNTMVRPSGMQISGTNAELWARFEESHGPLIGLYESGQAVFPLAGVASPMNTSADVQYPAPATPQQQGYTIPEAQAMTPAPTPMADIKQASPTPSRPFTPTQAIGKKRKRRGVSAVPKMTLATYQPNYDLNDSSAAREYLSRFDSDDAKPLNIAGDDVAYVQANLHVYAGKVFDALLHPYEANPTALDHDLRAKYTDQMQSATFWLQKNLATPANIKAAKACAILTVDAAVSVNTHGVSAERFSKFNTAVMKNIKPDDAWKMSPSLACSARVDAMVAVIQANKLVAKDVLEQKNQLRFAECPEAYLMRKYHFMRSNNTRQQKADDRAAEDEANGVQGRSARIKRTKMGNKAKYAEDSEDEDEFER